MPSYAFDASTLDIFPTLISGGSLLLVSAVEKRELAAQATRLQREHVTSVLLTPSLHSLYLDEIATAMSGLKWVCVAGEATTLSLVRRHFERLPGVRLFNEYGPTENSVVTTYKNQRSQPVPTSVFDFKPAADVRVSTPLGK